MDSEGSSPRPTLEQVSTPTPAPTLTPTTINKDQIQSMIDASSQALLGSLMQLVNGQRQADSSHRGTDNNKKDEVGNEDDDDGNDFSLLSDDDDEEGPPVDEKVAQFIDHKLSIPVPKERLEDKCKKSKRPQNIRFCKEVKVNRSIFEKLSIPVKKRDGSLRKIQGMVTKGLNHVVRVADSLFKKGKQSTTERTLSDEEMSTLHNEIFEGLGLLCQVSRQLNVKRVSLLLSCLSAYLVSYNIAVKAS